MLHRNCSRAVEEKSSQPQYKKAEQEVFEYEELELRICEEKIEQTNCQKEALKRRARDKTTEDGTGMTTLKKEEVQVDLEIVEDKERRSPRKKKESSEQQIGVEELGGEEEEWHRNCKEDNPRRIRVQSGTQRGATFRKGEINLDNNPMQCCADLENKPGG